MMDKGLSQVVRILPKELAAEFAAADICTAEEIRLRRGAAMTVLGEGRERRMGRAVSEDDLRTVLEKASQASVHTVLEQTRQGFMTLRGGHRIGLCGTAVVCGGEVRSLRYLSSLNIRVARAAEGQADAILPQIAEGGMIPNVLILGPPGAGKTTLLRDLIRACSDELKLRVGVADERGEISGMWQGEAQFRMGERTDIMEGCHKGDAITMLLRGMNPQVIAMDEITREEDAGAALDAVGCGVALLATAHAWGREDLNRRGIYRELMENRVFQYALVLHNRQGVRFVSVEKLA